MIARTLLVGGAVLVGCDSGSDADDGGMADEGLTEALDTEGGDSETGASDATGAAALRFQASSSVRQSMNLEDELTGSVYGALFFAADVGVTGPRDDAPSLASVETTAVDLTADGAVSEVEWTGEGLEPGEYVFLGYFDVDGSSVDLEDKDPDAGDPVTLPTVNKFTVESGGTAEVVIRFDLVLS
ncbi:MAG: hypothetical protein K0V04_24660 [Deltaproteobacteria bacterium]|nr:hypothetical protein [Deltaproteobacteria bacterium]